ncbi:hypothetical protein HanIR_Chr15g0751231 [Helianthus annuus]|nr:hypothetical protein HanIR_Chr15g0751231 [Helianthus annuus]
MFLLVEFTCDLLDYMVWQERGRGDEWGRGASRVYHVSRRGFALQALLWGDYGMGSPKT